VLYALQLTRDGGMMVGGDSASGANGNKTAPARGGNDFWVVRLDAVGNAVWDRSFGGAGDDALYAIQQTSDGGFILGGYSGSGATGNKSSPNYGLEDFWIVRLDANGNKVWDRSYGGPDKDILFALQQTSDGGFILGGYTASDVGGNKTNANLGGGDFWVVRIDSSGNKMWEREFGGSGEDGIYNLQITADGGFVLGGSSSSPADGNKTGANYGACDIWVVRLDANGNKLWDRSFGGSLDDGLFSVSIVETADRGYFVGGESYSGPNGNKTAPNRGSSDFWVVRLASNGNKLWDRSFGGTGDDYLTSLQQTANGGFVLAGGSNSSTNGNKTSVNFGQVDFWGVGLDANGNKLWDYCFGGSNADGFFNVSLRLLGDCGFVLAGDSRSGVSGDKSTASFGSYDFWLLGGSLVPAQLRILPQLPDEIASNGARFFLSGPSNCLHVVEYSTDLASWLPLQTNVLMGAEIQVTDRGAIGAPHRFYRARRVP